MYRSSFILFVVFIFASCQQDFNHDNQEPSDLLNIEPELSSYFTTFQKEAQKFGLTVDYSSSNVSAEIIQIDRGNVAGTCTTNGHSIRHIEIDESFWQRASYLQREMVIFHELGHCILGRGHKEGEFENGICQSIMRSGLGTCVDAYSQNNRDYFVEELFTQID